MLRRRLFAYTVMVVSGITAGYLFFECNKYLYASVLLVSMALAVRTADLEYIPEYCDAERMKLIACILMGFMLFTVSYIKFNGKIRCDGEVIQAEEICSVSGRIVSISKKEDALQMIIRPGELKNVGKILVSYYGEVEDGESYDELLGRKINVYGELKKPQGLDNPGCFNYRTYLYGRGIRFTYNAKYLEYIDDKDSSLVELYWKYRRSILRIREEFIKNFDKETAGFIKGIVFGDKSEIDPDTLNEFNANSTGHILAVSGLHVGFLFALLRLLTRKRKTKGIAAIICIVIMIYGEMTSWSPSTIRAVLVICIGMFSRYVGRDVDILSSVSCAALIIIIRNPYTMFNSGFQMSFLALLGITFISEPLSHYVGEYLSSLIAIQLAVAPMIAYTFMSFNISAIIINIPIVFLASLLVPICIICIILLIIVGAIPEIGIRVISNLTDFIIRLNSLLNFDGLFVKDVSGISIIMLITYYICLFLICSEWMRIRLLRQDKDAIKKAVVSLIVPILCVGLATFNHFTNDEIVFVNVGQGDCVHIRAGGNNILIDGGGNAYVNIGERTLRPYLLHNKVNEIDLALYTHQHTDHYKGLEELNEIFSIGGILQTETTDKVQVAENVVVEAIWPLQGHSSMRDMDDENENNTVYIVHYDDIKIMVTGDLTEEDELKMVDRYRGADVLKCDVLKVAHHGSKTSTSEAFLDAVNPEIAVIQVGANNTYGHPHQEVLDRLNERGIKTYRTDLNGAVGIDIRKSGIIVDMI